MSEGQFDPFGIVSNLHACMGDSCYCKPGNEHRWRWTKEDDERLTAALKLIAARAQERKPQP